MISCKLKCHWFLCPLLCRYCNTLLLKRFEDLLHSFEMPKWDSEIFVRRSFAGITDIHRMQMNYSLELLTLYTSKVENDEIFFFVVAIICLPAHAFKMAITMTPTHRMHVFRCLFIFSAWIKVTRQKQNEHEENTKRTRSTK